MSRDARIPDFVEKRFPYKVNFGFSGGPMFFTQVSTAQSGYEQRQVNWTAARHRYTASHEVKTQAELDELRGFFLAVRGSAVGFRFLDWADYASDMDAQKGTALFALAASGSMTPQRVENTVTGAIGVGDGTTTQYQLIKKYSPEPVKGELDHSTNPTLNFNNAGATIVRSTGSWVTDGLEVGDYVYISGSDSNEGTVSDSDGVPIPLSGVTAGTLTFAGADLTDETGTANVRVFSQEEDVAPYYRTITKPIAARGFVDGSPVTTSFDTKTGILTFAVPPAAGSTVTADFTFDVPVRLSNDEFVSQLQAFNVGDWAGIELIEIRT